MADTTEAYTQTSSPSDVSSLLFKMKVDAQAAMRRELMALPRGIHAPDVRSRRDPDAADTIYIGSFGSCDITSAVVGCNVVRRSTEIV